MTDKELRVGIIGHNRKAVLALAEAVTIASKNPCVVLIERQREELTPEQMVKIQEEIEFNNGQRREQNKKNYVPHWKKRFNRFSH